MLCGDPAVMQAPGFDGLSFDPFSLFQDSLATTEVDIGRGQIVDALVVTPVVVMFHECFDAGLKVTREEVVFRQDAVLQGLKPSFDLAPGLRMIWSTPDMAHVLVFQPVSQITRDVTGTVAGVCIVLRPDHSQMLSGRVPVCH
jgi:hypothetical protein